MAAPAFDVVKSEYSSLWRGMTINPYRQASVDRIAKRLAATTAKSRYKSVEKKTGVPWFVIAVIHEREASQNWNTQLGQGDPLDRVSTHVPKGMGPYFGADAWERAAIEALELDGLNKIRDWSVERTCYMLERYNGYGYRNHGIHSPYLWSFSNNYTAGKFVADGVWSANAIDQQCGCLPMIKGMMAIDSSVKFGTTAVATDTLVRPAAKPTVLPPVQPKHVGIVGAIGLAIAAVWQYAADHPFAVAAFVISAAAIAGAFYLTRTKKS